MKSLHRRTALSWAMAALFATPAASAHTDAHRAEPAAATSPASFGQPGLAKNVTRTVAIALTDAMRFTPSSMSVRRGETVRFRLTNGGKLPHEFVLGTKQELDEHAAMMRQMPDMVHTDANSARLAPGQSAEIVWQFSTSGTFLYACLVPGHWEAGMQGSVAVIAPVKR